MGHIAFWDVNMPHDVGSARFSEASKSRGKPAPTSIKAVDRVELSGNDHDVLVHALGHSHVRSIQGLHQHATQLSELATHAHTFHNIRLNHAGVSACAFESKGHSRIGT